ncbi:MAG: CoA-acylating methylmalonate-semialdehyde dehydrogenase [Dehalococcoidia bacterium]|nr:CoA-acylating methylmalonate-semialdehyde dehydrogenase [Dehalococcoidia bacterium]MDW8119787.1 CoA-acylating methylmalonate-semialdehyde dehydrogenase [Chloroflexota bacterium]
MLHERSVLNYIFGQWRAAESAEALDVVNPATQEVLGHTPLSTPRDVDAAVQSAVRAFPQWARTPAVERIQYLFRFKALVEAHMDALARTIVQENGKTLAEAKAELRRGIENIEVACGIPSLMQGYTSEDVAQGIDELVLRQPLGVVVAITPFNFPGMIPLWFLPYAIACGNTFILKPSEKVPLTAQLLVQLLEQTGLPPGVVNLVHGSKETVDALLDHPQVRAVSMVGSTPVARYIYARAAANGKRVQCQAGAKNHVVIMPDADMALAARAMAESAFGCAGQRCLAASVAVTVGEAHAPFREAIAEHALSLRVGYGLEEGIQMGPVISRQSKARIEGLIAQGLEEGGRLVVDGRNPRIPRYEQGNFIRPTIVEGIPLTSDLMRTEIFGPVLTLVHVRTLEEGIGVIAANPYGNAASIFTRSGAAARQFRSQVPVGNVGVNIGVPAPVAFFPFSGWKESFFGVLHGQGRDAVGFYTEQKVVIERWG